MLATIIFTVIGVGFLVGIAAFIGFLLIVYMLDHFDKWSKGGPDI